jgi:predicted PurR-regulated permease PerM
MEIREHVQTTFGALKKWFIAQCYDSLAVALMWLVGLWALKVPLAPFWAFLGGALQFVPNIGAVLALVGPVISLALKGAGWEPLIYLLILYALIMVVDGLVLQPYLMKRQNRVPVWASIIAPIVLGFVIPFWGVLLAPPLLAVVYAYKRRGEPVKAGDGIVIPPEKRVRK